MAHGAIDWELVRNALKRWVETTTGLQTVIDNEGRPFTDPTKQAMGILNILAVAQVGVDDRRVSLNGSAPAGEECVPEQAGLRLMTVSFRVESYTQEPNESARAYLEIARTGLQFARVKKLFTDAGLALVNTLPTVPLDAALDDRIRSIGAFDVRFHVASCLLDEPHGSVQQIEIRSNMIDDPAGNPVDPQIDETLTLP